MSVLTQAGVCQISNEFRRLGESRSTDGDQAISMFTRARKGLSVWKAWMAVPCRGSGALRCPLLDHGAKVRTILEEVTLSWELGISDYGLRITDGLSTGLDRAQAHRWPGLASESGSCAATMNAAGHPARASSAVCPVAFIVADSVLDSSAAPAYIFSSRRRNMFLLRRTNGGPNS